MHPCKVLLQAVATIMITVSCAHEPKSTSMPVSKTMGGTPQSRNLSSQTFNEVNQYRGEKGAKPLQRHSGLDQLAQRHAQYLIDNRGTFTLHGRTVSHDGFVGRTLIAREHYGMNNISENVASTTGGTSNAPRVFRNIWVSSHGHEHNMRSAWTHTGVGVAMADDGTVVAVQLFAVQGMKSHDAMMDKFRGF